MSNRLQKSALIAAVFCAAPIALAQDVLVNNVGYESTGPKRVVVQSASAVAAGKAYLVQAVGGRTVDSAVLGAEEKVTGWSGRSFRVADFSSFTTPGDYRVKFGASESYTFTIGTKVLQAKTGPDQLAYFKTFRSKDDGDKNLPIFGSSRTQNIYGGWFDATGDMGKHISHLSYANYFNPQQIPLVAWALLHARDCQPEAFGAAALEEAAWGADFLLRALSSDGYFYMSVFDNWGDGYRWTEPAAGSKAPREICAWSGSDGNRSAAYQCAMREGGGMSIAALARAAKAEISGDSTATQYLAGAVRAYAHLKANPRRYQDDGKENIIDDYCGLLAASELYNATGEETYRADARDRAASLLGRQSNDGWFYSDSARVRPFYHAADEGLPIVALSRYYEIMKERAGVQEMSVIRTAVGKSLRWYAKISVGDASNQNPFLYAKMYRAVGGDGGGGAVNGGDLARGRPARASREENNGNSSAANAFDGNSTTRWSSFQNNAPNDSQWIAVELDNVYMVDSVALNWENAYGKHYLIEVSLNGTSWTKAFEIKDNGSAGRKGHRFTAVNAKHVRMFGVTRGYEYGGFSLYDFEVYGEQPAPPTPPSSYQARYFIPHENETGYWWQGENARIASLSTAFAMGVSAADSGAALWNETLFGMATAQLDWILGKNPFELCMMYGYGKKSYPNYPSSAGIDNVKGGICNGITAKRANQNDIEWAPYSEEGDSAWCNWRWIEQWIPHNAWYLTAVSAISYNVEHGVPEDPVVIAVKYGAPVKSARLKISAVKGMGIKITLPFAANDRTEVAVYNIQGKKVYARKIPSGLRTVSMRLPQTTAKGTYVVNIKDLEGKNRGFGKIVFK
jgi:hypothetical protein